MTQVVELTRKLQKTKEMVQYLASQLEASELPISFQSYISLNKELKKTLSLAAKVANTNCTILIQGESGVGKEVMAKCIHSASNRKEQPMVKVNCASIPENLLESELFGYEEGAFTGARKGGKLGKFELANKGTILLDEIGDMSLTMQSKLLRVLQEKELERVGGTKTIKLDVRVKMNSEATSTTAFTLCRSIYRPCAAAEKISCLLSATLSPETVGMKVRISHPAPSVCWRNMTGPVM